MSNKKARDAITKARLALIMEHPFFGMAIMQLKLVECPWIPTMATDGHCIYYNPEFTLELTELERIGVLAHETFHCTYRHHLRMGSRSLERWNKATDYVINYDLIEAGLKLPDFALYDKQYAGRSSEEVYNLLPKDAGKGKNQNGEQGGQKGKGAGQGNGPAYAPDPGRMGGIIPPVAPHDKSAIEAETTRWETIAKQAAAVAKAANAGNLPGYLKRLVKDLDKPRVAWNTILRNFVDTFSQDEFNWNKLNRRYIGMGYKFPTLHSEKLKRIIGIMDTSGSVTDNLIKIYGAELSSFLDAGLADELTVLYADTIVQNIQNFERGDEVILDPKGGGGTNFRDVMNKVKEYDDATAIIFFTDLMTLDFGDEPDCPLIWAVYGDPRQYEQWVTKVPFGETVFIPEN